ncbi:DUF4376 domain-containing protein [Methylosinus sp. H3A]|uniref:DUF4376 domain-containing protein n=1 Tax=Methylosinus sp. H3A TaxID=2785786 RepID=UPI0018C28EF1|nr:DUF4376 domain-containing protein [Methylosinus sp. H3A]MBG0809842.1 DUF4376 domain-containing protein [Methylosinus sp. H3A]
MTYSTIADLSGLPFARVVRRDADGALVPVDSETADSRAYRDWLAAGHAPTPLPAPTLAALKAAKFAALADRRWRAETAGVTVGGLSIPSDAATQSKLTAAVVAGVLDNNYAVTWKLANGTFQLLDHATLIAVAQAVRAHVQGCFDHEATLTAAITAAADAAALAAIDIETGWPA